jgi:D-3-phosphoglycerate dehydrogenase
MNIIITEPKDYSSKALAIYKKLGQIYLWSDSNKTQKQSASILVIGLKYQIDKKFLDQIPNLKIIASPATGMNHIDVDYIKSKGIKLISLRGKKGFLRNVPSTAEETMALILSLARNIPWAFDDVKNGGWDRLKWRGHQLMGKTIGLLGFGRLGRIVARYAKAFGITLIACDPNVSEKFMKSRGVSKVGMKNFLKDQILFRYMFY